MAELTYTKNGDYLIPDLILDGEDELEEYPLGKYGMMRETFLKKHHHGIYTSMLLTGRDVAAARPSAPSPGWRNCDSSKNRTNPARLGTAPATSTPSKQP